MTKKEEIIKLSNELINSNKKLLAYRIISQSVYELNDLRIMELIDGMGGTF